MYEVAGEYVWIPLDHIFVDTEFNCRGTFLPQEVYDLGKSIKKDGQKVPLIVQPMEDVKGQPSDRPFRLVAGHRRYSAIDYWTQEKRAKCIIESGLTDRQSQALNFTENLQRKDLSILEEAKALKRTWGGEEIKVISQEINKPRRWVQTRLELLDLPEYVQRNADLLDGGLSDHDIELLTKAPENKVENLFQELSTTRFRPEKRDRKLRKGWNRRARNKTEMAEMIHVLYESHVIADMDKELLSKIISTLAWVSKGISTQEFLENRLDYPENSVIVDNEDKFVGFNDG